MSSLPSRNLGMHHLALRVRDIAAIRRFYVELLGFPIEREVTGEELWLCAGTDSLVFLRDNAASHGAGFDHLGFMVPLAEDIAAWEVYLRAHGVPILEAAERYDDDSVGLICQDPAGHPVQVLWHSQASAGLLGLGASPPAH